jgi:thioesterase domain-containing protein
MSDFLTRVAQLSPRKRQLLQRWLQERDGQGRSASGSGILTPLRQEGRHPPVFFIHPAGGQVVAYHLLVSLLPAQRPVYGLQSRALGGSLPEHDSLTDMAAEYAREVRQRQPEGPYHLLGWSMGGVLAHAVARLLEREGQQVAFLGLVDAHLFTDQSAESSDPLLSLGLALGNTFLKRFLEMPSTEQARLRESLDALELNQRLSQALSWGREQKLTSGEVSGSTLEVLRQRVTLSEQHERLLKGYLPPVVRASMEVWWASQSLREDRPPANWRLHTEGQVREHRLEGNHFELLRAPGCHVLAEQLARRLSTLEKHS